MYGIKMNRKKCDWPATLACPKGHNWVDKSGESYTTAKKAAQYENKYDAEQDVTEPWEKVVKIPTEKI